MAPAFFSIGKPMPFVLEPREIARILTKFKVDPETGCWNFTGCHDPKTKYCKIKCRNKTYRLNRVMFEVFVRPLEPAEDVHHMCRNRLCGNPAHLEAKPAEDHRTGHMFEAWIDSQLVGGPYDGATRSVRPHNYPEELVIEDRDGHHTYRWKNGEYVYDGIRRRASRRAKRINVRANSSWANKTRKVRKDNERRLFDA